MLEVLLLLIGRRVGHPKPPVGRDKGVGPAPVAAAGSAEEEDEAQAGSRSRGHSLSEQPRPAASSGARGTSSLCCCSCREFHPCLCVGGKWAWVSQSVDRREEQAPQRACCSAALDMKAMLP